MSQIRLKIDTTFLENKGAGIAVKYLNQEEIPLRDALGLALSCLFSPIGAAETGASQSEVESRSELPNHYLSDKELKAFYLGLETGEFLL